MAVQAVLEVGVVQYEPRGHWASATVPAGHQLPEEQAILVDGSGHANPAGHILGALDPAMQ